MKKTLFLTLAITTICIMSACNKDLDWFTNKITFGDTKDMDVFVYDSTFLSYSNPTQDEPVTVNWITCSSFVDLDYDGIGDVLFESYGGDFWASQYMSNDDYLSIHQCFTSSISCGNYGSKVALYCDETHYDSYYHSDTTILHSNDTTIVVIESVENHKPTSASDIYYGTYPSRILHPCNTGDQLSEKDFFERNPRPVFAFPYGAYGEEYHSNDTVVYNVDYYFDDPSFNFPLDEEKYIGLRLKTDDGKIKLGWLKIILVSQPDGTHRMRLLETAIQK